MSWEDEARRLDRENQRLRRDLVEKSKRIEALAKENGRLRRALDEGAKWKGEA